jgi:hypothetical protein
MAPVDPRVLITMLGPQDRVLEATAYLNNRLRLRSQISAHIETVPVQPALGARRLRLRQKLKM